MALLCLLVVGCERVTNSLPRRIRPPVPRVDATVLIYRTTILPKKKGFIHRVVIAENKARLGEDGNPWRLFDFTNDTVTFVDEIARTYRTTPTATLIRTRRNLVTKPLPFGIPAAELLVTGVTRQFGEFEAEQFVVRAGSYKREIWLSTETIAPPSFFGMILATDAIGEPNAPMYRATFPRLAQERGFPVLDRTDMELDGETYVIEKKLEKIETTTVPAEWLEIPADSIDETPATKSAGGRPAVSSTQPDRKIPAME